MRQKPVDILYIKAPSFDDIKKKIISNRDNIVSQESYILAKREKGFIENFLSIFFPPAYIQASS